LDIPSLRNSRAEKKSKRRLKNEQEEKGEGMEVWSVGKCDVLGANQGHVSWRAVIDITVIL
jgi:hypothetical protein